MLARNYLSVPNARHTALAVGLALVASVRGYRTLIVIPVTQSDEKKQTLRLAGARLVEVPAVPFANPNNYVHVARRLADRLAAAEPAVQYRKSVIVPTVIPWGP